MNIDAAAFYALFEQSPGDLTGYGAFADLLDTDGWSKLAHAFRWMSLRGVYPHRRESYMSGGKRSRTVPLNYRWAWYHRTPYMAKGVIRDVYPNAPLDVHGLPSMLMTCQRVFRTHQDAVLFLADRLAALGEVYCVEPPEPKGLPLFDILTEGYDGKTIREPPQVSFDLGGESE